MNALKHLVPAIAAVLGTALTTSALAATDSVDIEGYSRPVPIRPRAPAAGGSLEAVALPEANCSLAKDCGEDPGDKPQPAAGPSTRPATAANPDKGSVTAPDPDKGSGTDAAPGTAGDSGSDSDGADSPESRLRELKALQDGEKAAARKSPPGRDAFERAFSLARITMEGVRLMRDTETDVRKRFGDCLESVSFSSARVISCPRPADFSGSGEFVIFSFLPGGGEVVEMQTYFDDVGKANAAYERWRRTLAARFDTFAEPYAMAVDSVFWRVSLGDDAAGRGKWLRIRLNNLEEVTEAEKVAALPAQASNFGQLAFGRTSIQNLPATGPECEAAVYNTGTEREYRGRCFGFPYDAHILLRFSHKSALLKQAVISPLSQATRELLDEALRARYPAFERCRRTETRINVNTSRNLDVMKVERRFKSINGRPSTLYAGSCEAPRIFEIDGQFVFDFSVIDVQEMLSDYDARKSVNAGYQHRNSEREQRLQRLGEFFE